jgi:hypothetical protein
MRDSKPSHWHDRSRKLDKSHDKWQISSGGIAYLKMDMQDAQLGIKVLAG